MSGAYSLLDNIANLPQNAPLRILSEGGTSLMEMIFPHSSSMFGWFKGFSEKSLSKLGILPEVFNFKGPGTLLGSIPAPIGLPGARQSRGR